MKKTKTKKEPYKEKVKGLEIELNSLLKKFGFKDFIVIVDPNPTKDVYAEVDLKHRVIYIYTCEEDLAYRDFYHETLEIILSRILTKHKRLINKLLEYIEEDFYIEKERALNEIVDIIRRQII